MKFTGYFDDRVTEYEKLDENVNEVQLSTAYDHNCSEQQTEIINDEMLDTIIDSDNDLANKNRYDRKQRVEFPTTDAEAIKLGMIVPSMDDMMALKERQAEQTKKLLKIFSTLTEIERRRLYLYSWKKMSYSKIAKVEGVSIPAVMYSCDSAVEKLRPYGRYLQCCEVENWSKLLICTNL